MANIPANFEQFYAAKLTEMAGEDIDLMGDPPVASFLNVLQDTPIEDRARDPTAYLLAYMLSKSEASTRYKRTMKKIKKHRILSEKSLYRGKPYKANVNLQQEFEDNTAVFREQVGDFLKLENIPQTSAAVRTMKRISWLFTAADILKDVNRFVDNRNPDQWAHPLPDGSNLEAEELRFEWLFQRAWSRLVHSNYLLSSKGIQDGHLGWDGLERLVAISSSLRSLECEKVLSQNPSPLYTNCKRSVARTQFFHTPDTFKWIFDELRTNVLQELDTLADRASTRMRTALPHPHIYKRNRPLPENKYTILIENFDNRDLHGAMVTKLQGALDAGGLTPFTQNILRLLEKEYEFEDRLKIDHAEDYLVSKRLALREGSYDFDFNSWRGDSEAARENLMQKYLMQIHDNNRDRRNFRLLRDWSGGRPWKQLFLALEQEEWNPDANGLNAWRRIQSLFRKPPYTRPLGDSATLPSDETNIYTHLFAVHPLNLQRPPSYMDDRCTICGELWDPPQTLMELHCQHFFHVKCIFQIWDQPGVYRYNCPYRNCNKPPGLHQDKSFQHLRVGITPRYYDSWGYHESVAGDRLDALATNVQPFDIPPQPSQEQFEAEHRKRNTVNLLSSDEEDFEDAVEYQAHDDDGQVGDYWMNEWNFQEREGNPIDRIVQTQEGRDGLGRWRRRQAQEILTKALQEHETGVQSMQ